MNKQIRQGKIVLAITGGLGTGKSTVAGFLNKPGVKIIDADKIAKSLIEKGKPVYKKVVCSFGRGILDKNRNIDRKALSCMVFSDKKLLNKLNRLIHPQVISVMKKEIRSAKEKTIVLDIPLFFEAGLEFLADKVIVVKLGRRAQVMRLVKKTGLSKKEIFSRIKAQMPLSIKVRKADFVIDNSFSKEKTKKQTENLRRQLWKN